MQYTVINPFDNFHDSRWQVIFACDQGLNFIAAIAVEGEQNAVDHCGNDGNFLPYSIIFILFTVLYITILILEFRCWSNHA
jgi:hypothetical protein